MKSSVKSVTNAWIVIIIATTPSSLAWFAKTLRRLISITQLVLTKMCTLSFTSTLIHSGCLTMKKRIHHLHHLLRHLGLVGPLERRPILRELELPIHNHRVRQRILKGLSHLVRPQTHNQLEAPPIQILRGLAQHPIHREPPQTPTLNNLAQPVPKVW